MNTEVARETLATYQLQSMAIEDACSNGARWFHMGESEAGSGAERFKTYVGATPVEYHSLRFERLPLTRAEHGLREAFDRVSSWRARRTETADNGCGVRPVHQPSIVFSIYDDIIYVDFRTLARPDWLT